MSLFDMSGHHYTSSQRKEIMNKQETAAELRALKAKVAELEKRLEGPCWVGSDGQVHLIEKMNDYHLINALKVCLRVDTKYTFDTERMRSFAYMVLRASRSQIPKGKWING